MGRKRNKKQLNHNQPKKRRLSGGQKINLVVLDETNSDDDVYEDAEPDMALLDDSCDNNGSNKQGFSGSVAQSEVVSGASGIVTKEETPDSGCYSEERVLVQVASTSKVTVRDEKSSLQRSETDVIVLSDDEEEQPFFEAISYEREDEQVLQNKPTLDQSIFERIEEYKNRFPKAFEHFEYQINRHFLDNVQKDMTFWWKMEVRRNLLNAIKQGYPDANLVVVGSTVNGCGSVTSDMDLCCIIKDNAGSACYERVFAMKCLRKIQKMLFRNRNYVKLDKVQVINAKVPILRITFQYPYQNLEVDLNVNNTAGINNSHLLHYYSRIDDRLPSLCLLVKHWAKSNGIGEAMNGTFNSYSLILLCIHFLQKAVQPPILPNLQECFVDKFRYTENVGALMMFEDLPPNYPDPKLNTSTVGELLIAFFDYYSKFDFENWAISIKRGDVFPRNTLAMNNHRYKMYIEEPYDSMNTARCVTQDANFEKIVTCFREGREAFLGKYRPNLKRIKIGKIFGCSD
ncbi:unnamed protein product [Bursaphelenchus okinawaensis]|uniref:PAP-associated domain-containing protein n=1 Tax=Bursaphelenchus okinawaensis TaxID=465554 RepID=A0A811JSF9_9BILA|nr:unnamed protein product [Bursaphelenchus okinawaensis]CAG9081539.1 unnamed protein product [Bursaphelenchus okinawaensis]